MISLISPSNMSVDVAKRARLGKADAYRVRYVEKRVTPFERFFSGIAESRIGGAWLRQSGVGQEWFAQRLLARAMPQAAADLRFLDAAVQPTRGVPVKALAYCFCGF